MVKKIIDVLLIFFVFFILLCSWAVFPRATPGMTKIVDRMSLPQQSQLVSEKNVSRSPLCLDELNDDDCPLVRREWDLDRQLSNEELKKLIESTEPDFYFASDDNKLNKQGYCESACEFFAQVTTDRKYDTEIKYHPGKTYPPSITISITDSKSF